MLSHAPPPPLALYERTYHVRTSGERPLQFRRRAAAVEIKDTSGCQIILSDDEAVTTAYALLELVGLLPPDKRGTLAVHLTGEPRDD